MGSRGRVDPPLICLRHASIPTDLEALVRASNRPTSVLIFFAWARIGYHVRFQRRFNPRATVGRKALVNTSLIRC